MILGMVRDAKAGASQVRGLSELSGVLKELRKSFS